MRRLKLMTAIFALMITSVSFATENLDKPEKEELREQIVTLLGDFNNETTVATLEAEVSFTLNSDSEIMILDIESDHEALKSFIKRKLSNKKVDLKALNVGKVYRVPLTVVNQ